MEKFPSLRIQPSPNTTQLTTRASEHFAGEKTFLAKRDILYSLANKDSFVNQSSKLAEEELTCDSYKYINALHLLSEAMCMVIKLTTKGVSLSQVLPLMREHLTSLYCIC